jgi:N-acetyl-gamma-glutamyl-phosphate reductase
MGLQATVLGASGYSGGELLRLLASHPAIAVAAVAAHSRAGDPLEAALPHLAGDRTELLTLAEAVSVPADICFSCLPGGELGDRLDSIDASLVVDLSDDHRADAGWVYGLSEFAREQIVDATRVANPGCYPTGTLLALLPFARAGVIEAPIVVDALSGVSGAGRRAEDRLLHANLSGSAGAYGDIPHRHVAEMERGLQAFGDLQAPVSFTPHLIPTARGLVVTARARMRTETSDADALDILRRAYRGERFVKVIEAWPSSKAVDGSNAALVSAHVDARAGWLIASAVIDNLGKGAAGQALQNANIALGLDEGAGLPEIGVWP